MKKFLGVTALLLLSPILLILAVLTVVGTCAFKTYDFIYFPIYKFAGKPFDIRH